MWKELREFSDLLMEEQLLAYLPLHNSTYVS